MHIFSLILTTITSVVNAGFTIIALGGGFATSYANSSAGLLPRTIAPLIYNFILPAVLFFFVLSFAIKSEKSGSKVAKHLRVAFGLALFQAIFSVVMYQLNYTSLTSSSATDINILPIIIEAVVIAVTFALATIFTIKATDNKIKVDFSPKLLALLALILGLMEFVLEVVPIIIFKINPNNSITQPLLQWTEYLRMLNPAIFAFAAINSLRKIDRWTVISWLGVLLAFLARIILYTIAYI